MMLSALAFREVPDVGAGFVLFEPQWNQWPIRVGGTKVEPLGGICVWVVELEVTDRTQKTSPAVRKIRGGYGSARAWLDLVWTKRGCGQSVQAWGKKRGEKGAHTQ